VIAATDALARARADVRTGRILESVRLQLAEAQRPDAVLSSGPPAVALSPDCRYLLYPTRSRHLALADWKAGRVHWTAPVGGTGLSQHIAPVFSSDGSKVSAGGLYQPLTYGPETFPPLHVWQAATGQQLPGWAPGAGRRACVAFSPDGTRVAAVAGDAIRTDNRLTARDLAAGRPLLNTTGGFGLWLAVAPDNRTVLVTEENHIVGRDLATGRVTRSLDFIPRQDKAFMEWRLSKGPWDRVGHLLTCPFTFSPDGRLFAVGCVAEQTGAAQIRVFEWAGFGERFRLTGHAGPVRALAFSPDGKRLASGSEDTTLLLWDLSRAWAPAPRKAPSAREALWARLGGPEVGPAWKAMRELAARPDVALSLLKERLRPAAPLAVTEADVPDLVRRLGAAAFAERERAARDLRHLGPRAVPLLRKALAGAPSLEVRRRLEALLRDADRPDPALRRTSRAVEILEQIGGPRARAVLESLAGGAPGQALTEQARAALVRMKR
jgi:hypothetical protein